MLDLTNLSAMIFTVENYDFDKSLKEIDRLSRSYLSDVNFLKGRSLIEIFDYVKNIPYKPDPKNTEFIMRPKRLLLRNAGDCDDKAVFLNAVFLSNGIPGGYSIVSQSPDRNWHHIFNYVYVNGERKDFDATYPKNLPFVSKPWAKRKDFDL